MNGLDQLLIKAARNRRVIALAEGGDPRIARGALMALDHGVADVLLVGETRSVEAELTRQGGLGKQGVTLHDPDDSPLHNSFANTYYQLRKHKGMTLRMAARAVRDPLVFTAMLVRMGHADGSVAGATSTTADTMRAALHFIGKHPESALVSSFFLMQPDMERHPDVPMLLFSDCGLVAEPDENELASIALASAASYRALTGDAPRVAMLSFSSKGSASHRAVSKVRRATQIAAQADPTLLIDGELQFDAAFVPAVAASKASASALQGRANVFIFPNLDAGNIGYKIAQRLGGMTAIGPILQGLNQPANDLSRGCDAQDVLHMIAVTALQSAEISAR